MERERETGHKTEETSGTGSSSSPRSQNEVLAFTRSSGPLFLLEYDTQKHCYKTTTRPDYHAVRTMVDRFLTRRQSLTKKNGDKNNLKDQKTNIMEAF